MEITYSTVLFVPCTPGSILAKELKQVEAIYTRGADDRGWREKIVEMGVPLCAHRLVDQTHGIRSPVGDRTVFHAKQIKAETAKDEI